MTRAIYLVVAAVCYAIFFATFLYLIAFVGDLPWVPVTVDRGPSAPELLAVVVNLGLIAGFGVQHSVMARPAFKAAWTRIVPAALERSVYVLAASLMLILLFALWHPIPAVLWSVTGPAAWVLWALFLTGWGVVLLSTFLINHFELFGLQQVWLNLTGQTARPPEFRTPFLYRLVRHPLYLGFLIAFWATPTMTYGHLLLAAGMTVYILIAIPIEEGDLIQMFGTRYTDYKQRVGSLMPKLGR
jgi:methanethiol S-methyltransferase